MSTLVRRAAPALGAGTLSLAPQRTHTNGRPGQPLGLTFFPGPHHEEVHIEGTVRTAALTFRGLERVPKGELRELCRAGFRAQCLLRTKHTRTLRDARVTWHTLQLFIHRLEEGRDDE